MDFDLNDEQRQLKDSVERLLTASYGDLNKRMGYMKEPKGYSARALEAVRGSGSARRYRSPRSTAGSVRVSPRP